MQTIKPQIKTTAGWTELVIDDDCEFDKFYRTAKLLKTEFKLRFTNKIDDYDTLYWDFKYKTNKLVLHYNIYLGISIFPLAFKEATESDNASVIEIGTLLFQKLIDIDWTNFDSGKTIGTTGPENGTVVSDIESSNGARITLDQFSGNLPFVITLGIYGLMFHTHFESDLEKANNYIMQTKFKTNKIFDLYDVPEEKRTDYWQTKLDKRVNDIYKISETPSNE